MMISNYLNGEEIGRSFIFPVQIFLVSFLGRWLHFVPRPAASGRAWGHIPRGPKMCRVAFLLLNPPDVSEN